MYYTSKTVPEGWEIALFVKQMHYKHFDFPKTHISKVQFCGALCDPRTWEVKK